jgi:isoquinoline 1-oxidoreductase subunit beta
MDRRAFIKISSLATGGLLLSFPSIASANVDSTSTASIGDTSALGNFLKIDLQGNILFQLTKHEMGQGVSTSLAMILAEELDADWENVKIEFIVANLTVHQNAANGGYGTGGSTTVLDMYPILRKAGATARALLIESAADVWKVSPESCSAEKSKVIHTATQREFSYGELADAASKRSLPQNVVLKNDTQFSIVGKSVNGKLIPAIVTGKNNYGIDAQIPGMLYAVVARSPVYHGKIKSIDDSQTRKVKGVRSVVTTKAVAGTKGHFMFDIREGVAVVADSFWAAQKGREALRIEWENPAGVANSIEAFEKNTARKASVRIDPTGFIGNENAMADLSKVKSTHRATYIYPYQLHSPMEPLNCTAHFKGDSCDVHIGAQAPHYVIRNIMSHFQLAQDKINVQLYPSGGGFGRRWYPDAALEALCISKGIGNLPVKMIWTREDDQTTNLAHCYVHSNYLATIDKQDTLHSWYQKELRTYTWGSEVANPELTWIGYDIPNIRYDFENLLEDSLVQSCAWRSVVANAWAFGQESFIDELAHTLKKDPLEFRLSLLKKGREALVGHSHTVSNDRLIRVLSLASEKAEWGRSMPSGRGLGIAAYPYMHGNSYCAMVAEVTVTDDKLKIDKITCAVDCGRVINHSGVKNQIEGGVIWGLTAMLYGGVNIQDGKAVNTNFHQNKILRMDECPVIEIFFVDSDEKNPFGVGELAPPVTIPAVLNAVFAASQKRIRKLPVKL